MTTPHPSVPGIEAARGDGSVTRIDEFDVCVVTSAKATRDALRSPSFSAAWLRAATPLHDGPRKLVEFGLERWFMFMDGNEHSALRGLLASMFAPAHVAGFYPRVNEIVDEEVSRRSAGERIEVAVDLSPTISARVLCLVSGMAEDYVPDLRRWGAAIGDLFRRDYLPDVVEKGRIALEELNAASLRAVEEAAEATTAAGVLRAAVSEGKLSLEDATTTVALVVYAGYPTTATFTTNAVYELVEGGVLAEGRDRERAGDLVDELLRLHTSAPQAPRCVARETELGGVRLKPGELVLIRFADANRDPQEFEEPDAFRPERRRRTLAFGYGPHYCLGAPVAREEAISMVHNLASRWPDATIVREATSVAGTDPRTFHSLELALPSTRERRKR
jgi:cytochrome P450